MCLVKVRQEEDIYPPSRTVIRTRSPSPHRRTSRRISRTEVIRETHSRPHSSTHLSVVRPPSATYVSSPSYHQVPAPSYKQIPAPQPVPVFVQPPPPPPMPMPMPAPSHVGSHHSHHHGAHYVEVSPRSSVTSDDSPSEYVVHEREYRREARRDYSPEQHSPRYEHYRYVDAGPPSESEHGFDVRYTRTRERSRSRARSRSRDYGRGSGYDDGFRETRERVVVSDGRGGGREYRR